MSKRRIRKPIVKGNSKNSGCLGAIVFIAIIAYALGLGGKSDDGKDTTEVAAITTTQTATTTTEEITIENSTTEEITITEESITEHTTVETTTTVDEIITTEQPTTEYVHMVWIAGSGNGTKYHSKSSCSNMSNPVEISLSDAENRGYTPCKKCY